MMARKERSLTDMMDEGEGEAIQRSSYLRSQSPVSNSESKQVDGTTTIGLLSMGKGGNSHVKQFDNYDYGVVRQYDDDCESDETTTRKEVAAALLKIDPETVNANTKIKQSVKPQSPPRQTEVAEMLLGDQIDDESQYSHIQYNNTTHHAPITPKVGWLLGENGTALPQTSSHKFDFIETNDRSSPTSNHYDDRPFSQLINQYNETHYRKEVGRSSETHHRTEVGNRAEQSLPLKIAAPRRQTLQLPTFNPHEVVGSPHHTMTSRSGVSISPHRSPTRIKSITKDLNYSSSIGRTRASSLVNRSTSRSPARGYYTNSGEELDTSIQYGKPLQPPSPVTPTFHAQDAPIISRRKKLRLPNNVSGTESGLRDTLQHNFENAEVVADIWDPVQYHGNGLSPHEPVRLQRSASIPLNIETVVVIDEDADRLEYEQNIKDLQMIRHIQQTAGSLSYSKSPSSSPGRVPNGMNKYPKGEYRGEPYGFAVKSPPHQVVKSPISSPRNSLRSPPQTPGNGLTRKAPTGSLRNKSPPTSRHSYPIPQLVQKGYPTRLPGNKSISASPANRYNTDRLPYGSPNEGDMVACSISPTSSQMSPVRISPNLTFADKNNKKEYTLMFVERAASPVKSVVCI